jgi:hypothetical protein
LKRWRVEVLELAKCGQSAATAHLYRGRHI